MSLSGEKRLDLERDLRVLPEDSARQKRNLQQNSSDLEDYLEFLEAVGAFERVKAKATYFAAQFSL